MIETGIARLNQLKLINIMTKSQKQGKLYLQITIVVTIILFNLLTYLVS